MGRYIAMIERFEAERNAQHAAFKAAVAERNASPAKRAAWEAAARAFATGEAEVFEWLDRCLEEGGMADREVRRFAFDYVAAAPMFYRSGYTLQLLLRRIKPLDLTEAEQAVLRREILRRIAQGARREFRHLCRFVPRIADPAFRAQVEAAAASPDPQVRRRAGFALGYFR